MRGRVHWLDFRSIKERALFRGGALVLLAALVVPGWDKGLAMDVAVLKGRWVLDAINGEAVVTTGPEVYVEITEQTIAGFDGCNRFGGSASQPSAIRSTQRACDAGTIVFPLDLSDPVRQLSAAKVKDDKLFLPLRHGRGEAVFRRG